MGTQVGRVTTSRLAAGSTEHVLAFVARVLISGIFLWAAYSKAHHPAETLESLRAGLGPLSRVGPLVLYVLVAVEILIALLLLLVSEHGVVWALLFAISVAFIAWITWLWMFATDAGCGCGAAPATDSASLDRIFGLLRNGSIAVIAITLLRRANGAQDVTHNGEFTESAVRVMKGVSK